MYGSQVFRKQGICSILIVTVNGSLLIEKVSHSCLWLFAAPACCNYDCRADVQHGFCRKACLSYDWVLLFVGSPCCDDCCRACQAAVVAASPDVVVAWLLPRDFGGSHDYVSLWPERICTSYCRQ